jgi:hypothetical protein
MIMKSTIPRAFALVVWLIALSAVVAMYRAKLHKINRLSDGTYEIVYYQVLAWKWSTGVYNTVATVASLVVWAGMLIMWRLGRRPANSGNAAPAKTPGEHRP